MISLYSYPIFGFRVDYSVNPKVRTGGKSNFLADKNGTGMGMLIALQGRAITPSQQHKTSKFNLFLNNCVLILIANQ